jgi:hypothetical protein
MRVLSLVLIILVILAVAGLFYEFVVDRRRAQIRERHRRDLERLVTPPPRRTHNGR